MIKDGPLIDRAALDLPVSRAGEQHEGWDMPYADFPDGLLADSRY